MNTFTSNKRLPKQVGAFPRNQEVLKAVFSRVRASYPKVEGLTAVTPNAAIFQIVGDPTRYCVSISESEAAALGYIEL